MDLINKILHPFKPKELMRYRCNSCNRVWNSMSNYRKCPECKSKNIEKKPFG